MNTELVSLTIDDQRLSVPKGTLVIRAAEQLGIEIPRFCDHPLLQPVGACRQCLVEVEGQRKPMASCTTPAAEGMVVRTQLTSATAESAQRGVMELLLINHPLDCPVCDKGGECPLQNQAMTVGRAESRFRHAKRTFAKPIPLSAQVLLDRERCVLCARCTRFSQEIAGDPFIELLERGALQQVGTATDADFDSYFSGNAVQICPVGALTGATYRFRARPFDLVSTPSVCEHCASGCAQRTDHRRGKVLRRQAGDDPEVNEEWNCDKGRWAFGYAVQHDRIATPLMRDADGTQRPASWSEAVAAAAAGLGAHAGRAGVLVGGRATTDDANAYSEFARTVLHTNDIDFRIRSHSLEEEWFLATRIAGTPLAVTYADLESAPMVLLVGFEPEEESPIVFLRLRKAARTNALPIVAVAPFATRGFHKLGGRLVMAGPGDESGALEAMSVPHGTIILAGERLASSPGALTSAAALADRCSARLAWVPRRAGERGALEAGCLPSLLPGGRPVDHPRAREQACAQWRVAGLPTAPGRDTSGMLSAAIAGDLGALVLGGVDTADLPDPHTALTAVERSDFVVSLEMRATPVTARADVVFPIAPVAEKAGAFLNWEGRLRPFAAALDSGALSDADVLRAIAMAMGRELCVGLRGAVRGWDGGRPEPPRASSPPRRAPRRGEALLATWKHLVGDGRLLEGSAQLAATARPAVTRLAAATAAEIGVTEGEPVTVSTDAGTLTLPLVITDMPERVVWVPTNSAGRPVPATLRVTSGALVRISGGADASP